MHGDSSFILERVPPTDMSVACALLLVTISTTVYCSGSYSVLASGKTNHLVIAPKLVRPSTVYNVVVLLLDDKPQTVSVYAALTRNGEEIAAASETVAPRLLQTIPLKVPMSISDGDYHLKVEGSHRGALMFKNITDLRFTPRFLSVVVQTSRPIYRAGQEVRFRILVLQTDLRPFDDGMEIYIIDPDGFIMRRWVSAYTNNGVSSLKFKLPKMAKDGYWKIRIKAWEQIEEHKIRVETYFSPLFEVHVKMLPYVLETEEEIIARISGLYTSEKIARGSATLTLFGRSLELNDTFKNIWSDTVFIKQKDYEISFPMDQVRIVMGRADKIELRLEVQMTEFMSGETVSGYSHTRIIPGRLHLRFLSTQPAVFKPGMPFYSQVAITYQDNEPVPPESIATSQLRIQVTVGLDTGGQISLPDIVTRSEQIEQLSEDDEENSVDYQTNYMKQIFANQISQEKYREEGIFPFKIDVPSNTEYVLLKAFYTNEDGSSLETTLNVVKYFSPVKRYLSVWSSTTDAQAGEFAIFHVKSNFKMDSLQYLVLSKDQILSVGEQSIYSISPTTTTMNVPVSAAMAPGFRLLVFHVASDGEILADSCFLPVEGLNRYETELELNTGKDFKAERVELRVSGDEGAYIAAHAVRSSVYMLQAGNEMTLARVTDNLMSFENFSRSVHKVRWASRDGSVADNTVYLPSMDYGLDVNETFLFSGLVAFSTLGISMSPNSETCKVKGEEPCGLIGCYPKEKKCNGIYDCKNGEDEVGCDQMELDDYEYRVMRMSRFTFLYDDEFGDWGWREIRKNDHEGIEFEPLTAPPMADNWYFTAFSVSNRLGFTIISEPVVFSSKRPFTMHISGPSTCHRGEQLGLRLILNNHDTSEALVLLRLIGSEDYKFVHVEEGGIVSSYGARLSSGDHQLLVYLAPESQEHIDFPVAPTVEKGDVDITFFASTQSGRSFVTHKVTVLGEGAIINKHTSVFLDLKSRAHVLRYLDIIVEETPIVPYQEWRRYIFGSTKASLTLTGDIIGPAFPEIPVSTKNMLGRVAKGTDARAFELAANIWTLHYLRLTNQLRLPIMKEVLEECNALFANIMKRCNPAGWFRNWDTSEPSVWLTAWVLRIFKHATFPDWENNFYIEPAIFERSLGWLLQFQAQNGSFYETTAYDIPLDSKLNTNNSHIILTAHVLITLTECAELVSGSVRGAAVVAGQRAARYLEHLLHSITDPYQISITTYALTLIMSSEKDLGFIFLQQKQRQNTDGLIYWSDHDIPTNPVKLENQRPFTKPRVYHESDSLAVEATAWALLVMLSKDGVTDAAEKIVQWLNCIRMTNSGFISTVDTTVALQALTEYAFRARLLDITDITVAVELSTAEKHRKILHIGNSSYTQPEALEIPHVWGHINVIAKGAGQAVVQMDVEYGIDYEPLREVPTYPSFSLNITEYYSTYRNKSAIIIQSCFRWIREWPRTSGAAVLEIDIPTGYHLLESEAEWIAQSGAHPTLRDGRTVEGKTVWFFERIYPERTCFNHTVRRWFPVANITLHRQALLYESTARERFVQVLFNSTPLYVLNICEVCGSFQCPYCPYYNTAATFSSLFTLPAFTLISIYRSIY